jgi:hypothetical protein
MNHEMNLIMRSQGAEISATEDLAALLRALAEHKCVPDSSVSVRATEKMTAVWGG